MLDPLDALVLLITQNEKSIETAKEVERFLAFANVKCELIEVSNIFNFFEVLVVLENLAEARGVPLWLNVSAGPGIAISALTYFAISHDSVVVFYNRENDKTSRVEIAKSKDLFKNARKNFKLLSLLKNSTQSLDNLSSKLNLSKSTISRRVRVLKSAYLVETKYLDKKMLVYISETGLKLLGAKSMLMPS
jgi:CRISPR locus-related DNA-binding protein